MKPTFENLTLSDQTPIYIQIVKRFKLMLAQGSLKDGDEAPSRRMLAMVLGVNPNTVQRAFAELEQSGLIETPPNAKSVVRIDDDARRRILSELLEGQVGELIELSRQLGLSYKQLIDLISDAWG